MINPEYWNLSPKQAIALQLELRDNVCLADDIGEVNIIAGVDVSIGRGWSHGKCGIVMLSFPDLKIIETRTHIAPITFPYVPGLLAFRELPIFFETYDLLENKPDLLFFDGHGYAHPRRFGFACMGGVLLDKPSIGCAKSRLIGHFSEPSNEPGAVSPLFDDSERIGNVIRTKTGSKPVFISPGHKVSFDTAIEFTIRCTRGYRIPEPTRLAHNLVSGGGIQIKKE